MQAPAVERIAMWILRLQQVFSKRRRGGGVGEGGRQGRSLREGEREGREDSFH